GHLPVQDLESGTYGRDLAEAKPDEASEIHHYDGGNDYEKPNSQTRDERPEADHGKVDSGGSELGGDLKLDVVHHGRQEPDDGHHDPAADQNRPNHQPLRQGAGR